MYDRRHELAGWYLAIAALLILLFLLVFPLVAYGQETETPTPSPSPTVPPATPTASPTPGPTPFDLLGADVDIACPEDLPAGTPWPPEDTSDLAFDYVARCSPCWATPVPTSAYSIIHPEAGGLPGADEVTLGSNVLVGREFPDTMLFSAGDEWRVIVDSSSNVKNWAEGAETHYYAQSVDLGPYEYAPLGFVAVLDVHRNTEGTASLFGWAVSVSDGKWYIPGVSSSFFSADTPLINSVSYEVDSTTAVTLCVGLPDYCAAVAPGALLGAEYTPSIEGAFVLGLGLKYDGGADPETWFDISSIQLISAAPPAPTPTPSPTPDSSPWTGWHTASSVECWEVGNSTVSNESASLYQGGGSLTFNMVYPPAGTDYVYCLWTFNPPIYVTGNPEPGKSTFRMYYSAEREGEYEEVFIAAAGAGEWCYTRTGNVGWPSGWPTDDLLINSCHMQYIDRVRWQTNAGGGVTWGGSLDAPALYGSASNPNLEPTATPGPTATPTATPGPGEAVAEYCKYPVWRDTSPAVDFDLGGDDWIIEGDCYTVVPQYSVSIPGFEAIGFEGVDISWDGYQMCVNWVRWPSASILGVVISLDWVLVVPLAFLVRRFLQF